LALVRLRAPSAAPADDAPPVLAAADPTDFPAAAPLSRPLLLALERPAVAGLLLLALLAVAVAGARLWWTRPEERPLPARRVVVEAPAATGTPEAAASAGVVVVHVAGAVRRPGVVELPSGSRVAQAIDRVGGLRRRADPASVNLARPLVDGEQIVVLRRGSAVAAPVTPGGGGAPQAGPVGPVRLNTATVQELDALPGIGPVLAQRIVDWRTEHQRFTSVEELGEVSGIGESTLADLRPLVTL
jgi:competence protein ComEA